MHTAAVVGLGDISPLHLEAISANPEIQLVGVCDVDEARARAAGERWQVPWFTDHAALFAEVHPDVVHITLPHNLHASVAADALAAGSHVLTEKPLAHTLAEGRRIADIARASDRKFAVCLQNRYNPTSLALKEALEAGTYGRVIGGRAAVWWSRTPAYYAASPWRGTWDGSGGGALINQSIHTLDLLCWMLGVPEKVSGRAFRLALDGVVEVEDTATIALTHPDGVRSSFLATNAHFENAPVELSITTDGGTLAIQDGSLHHIALDGTVVQLASDTQASGARGYWGRGHAILIDDFYSKLEDPEKFWIDADAGLVALGVLRAVHVQSGMVAESDM